MDTTNFLPIGSVVLLNEGTKKLMITGFCTVPEDSPEDVYDYCGCLYPEGVISSDEIYVFDHEQIQDILFIGYEDDEQKEFQETLLDTVGEIYKDDIDEAIKELEAEKAKANSAPVVSNDYEEIERL